MEVDEHIPILPWEVIDQILIRINSSMLAIELDRICILKKICDPRPSTKWAIENGKLEYLKWLAEFGRIKTNWTISNPLVSATSSNFIEVLKFWHENVESLASFPYIDYAASAGHLDLVIYLHYNDVRATSDAMDRAACRGHLSIVRFLHFHRNEGCTSRALNGAAKNCHLPVVRFLVEVRGELITARTLHSARKDRDVYDYLDAEISQDW
jgi:hypothetical protein